MAIITVQAPVAGIRGKLGGLIYSANKSGPYARPWSRGANPRTNFQTAQRSSFSSIPVLWNALTGVQKAAWDTFAALPAQELFNPLGESYFASGYNWFSKCNIRLINMDRATITATPVVARPAAPTISSLQLPFLTGQIAKITYPSGEFTATQDQVIELGVVNSTGRQVEPTNFLTLKQDQDPPDTDQVFRVPYGERWNLIGTAYKGFVRVYRQTEEGIRSSPGTANFISTDSAAYVATADDYDGATNYALRGSDLTGNTDTKLCTVSAWFRIDAGDGTARWLYSNAFSHIVFILGTDNLFRLNLQNAAGTTILNMKTPAPFLAGAPWHNVIASVDLSTGRAQMAVDGLQVTPTIPTGPTDDTPDWTTGNHSIGADTAGGNKFDGCVSDVYINNTQSLDLDNNNNIEAFISSSGDPVDLGATAAFPTGTQPILAFLGGDPSTNLGSGGNLVNQAALGACSSSP